MVQLTVLLIRDAETEAEVRWAKDPEAPERELDYDVNETLKKYINDQAGDEAGKASAADGEEELTLSQRVDPELTEQGYIQAQEALTHVLQQVAGAVDENQNGVIDEDEIKAQDHHERKIAVFSAPNRSCAATALMLTCADVSYYENLTWRLSTLEAASAPAAIPVIVSNGLCNNDSHVIKLGGYKACVEGGMMHCAAMKFNDGRTKCPLMKAFKKMREKTHDRIDEWDEARDETTGKKLHYVNYMQFMRYEKPFKSKDPWALIGMTPKINIVVEYTEPKRYMLPPRKGWFDPQDNYSEWKEGIEPSLKQTIWWARQAGCETVMIFVPAPVLKAIDSETKASACSAVSLVVNIPDKAKSADDVSWTVFRSTNLLKKEQGILPPFPGPINELKHPHEGQDPADAPHNQWAAFPDPEPEVLAPNYPDLPPFSMSLEAPLPPEPKLRDIPGITDQEKPKKKGPPSSQSRPPPPGGPRRGPPPPPGQRPPARRGPPPSSGRPQQRPPAMKNRPPAMKPKEPRRRPPPPSETGGATQ